MSDPLDELGAQGKTICSAYRERAEAAESSLSKALARVAELERDYVDKARAWDACVEARKETKEKTEAELLSEFLIEYDPKSAAADMRERAAKLVEQAIKQGLPVQVSATLAQNIRALPLTALQDTDDG